jgi:transposase
MIAPAANVRVWLACGHTDMRRAFDGLSSQVQQHLEQSPGRRPLLENLPREVIEHAAPCACPNCGGALRPLGEDVTEVLDYTPASFRVIRHVRPKLSCRSCETIAQAEVPSLPIQRGPATPALLAHVLVAKYADHCPLYRQAEIYARADIELDRSTLADWVGQSASLLRPLVDAVGAHVMAADRVHADDTTVPVLDPGRGTTKTGRLWCYVRDYVDVDISAMTGHSTGPHHRSPPTSIVPTGSVSIRPSISRVSPDSFRPTAMQDMFPRNLCCLGVLWPHGTSG